MLTGQPIGRLYDSNSSRSAVSSSRGNLKRPRLALSWDWLGLSVGSWFVLVGVVLCVLICPAAAEEPAVKNVLVLHNWANLPQSWNLMESTVRARVPGQINFYNASVENPRFDEKSYQESLAETLRRGYGGMKLDLVIAATYPVLQFTMQYRDRMFPGVRVVFTDVSRQEEPKVFPGVPGVISSVGMRETIDLALRLNPDTRTVAVITGVRDWDRYWLSVAHTELQRRQDKVKEIDIVGP